MDRWTHRQRVLAALALTLAVVTLPFIELLLGLRTGMYNDINGAHLPRYVGVWKNLRDGESPFWWGTIFSGQNGLGAGQSAPFYIPNIIFGWVHPVAAFRWWFFAHLWLMAAGWFAWSWRRWGSLTGAVVSGIVGTLNGVLVSHFIDTPYIAAIALVPWVMLVADLVLDNPRPRHVAVLALLLTGLTFTGHPQLLWLVLVALGFVLIVHIFQRPVPWRAAIGICSSIALSLALSAAALLPQVIFGRTSVRPRLDKAGAFAISEEPRHLWTLLAPNIMGGAQSAFGWKTRFLGGTEQPEQLNYLGIIAVALTIIAIVTHRRDRRVWAFVLMGVFGLLSSLAGHTPFGDIVFEIVPFADRFRVWARNLLLLNIGVSSLAALGIKEVLRQPKRWISATFLGAAGLAVVLGSLPGFTNLGGALMRGAEGTLARLLPVIMILLFVGGLGFCVRSPRHGALALIAVCAIDMGNFAASGLWRGEGATRAESRLIWDSDSPFFGAVADAPNGLDRWVSDVADSSTLWPAVLGSDAPTINGYDPLLQADYSLSVGDMAYNGYLRTNRFWQPGWLPDVLRVSTLLASPYAEQPNSSWTYRASVGAQSVWDYTPRLAETYLVGEARVRSLDEARAGIYDPNTPLTEFAYVDTGTITSRDTPRFAELAQPGASGTVVDGAMDDGGHGTWTVSAERPSLFVTSYAWMDGWTATVDGKPVPVARTNALVLGVPVPAGQHEVQLTFTPPGWTTGRNVSIVAAVLVLALLVADTRRARAQWARLRAAARSRRSAPTATSISG